MTRAKPATATPRSVTLSKAREVLGLIAGALLATLAWASAAAGATVDLRGSIACPAGKNIVGAWVNSSGGGAGWLSRTGYPGAPTIARVGRRLETTLPTTISASVGCGGSSSSWGSSSPTPAVKVAAASTLHYNVECAAVGSCRTFRNDDNDPPSPATNPTADSTQCTYRASEFFKIMTGRHRNFYGDAGTWDTAAANVGWEIRSWPRPDSIAIWQPNQAGASSAGHVGYVADTRVASGVLQMKIYDRNWIGPGEDRNGVWVPFAAGMKFIVAAPRLHTAY